mmetsp:Transcript_62744/g.147893  ORF Transcript_62744/g.147893 Transcript_62744/m.147893 type:complete len:243 (-) Transcript_62744:161-889(-)
MVAAFALSVDHLLVGKDSAESRTPVDWNFSLVSETLLVQLEEDPLRPLVVLLVSSSNLAIPVVAEAKCLELFAETVDVLLGGDARVCACLDGVLLSRQAESVPSHGMHDIEAVHALEAREDVSGSVAFRVAHVQASAGGVREHVQNIILRLGHVHIVRRTESLVVLPLLLPFLFNIRERVARSRGAQLCLRICRCCHPHSAHTQRVPQSERQERWSDSPLSRVRRTQAEAGFRFQLARVEEG